MPRKPVLLRPAAVPLCLLHPSPLPLPLAPASRPSPTLPCMRLHSIHHQYSPYMPAPRASPPPPPVPLPSCERARQAPPATCTRTAFT